jgi:transposase
MIPAAGRRRRGWRFAIIFTKRAEEAVMSNGLPRNAAARRFEVSIASAVRWMKQFKTTGKISPMPSGGDRRSGRFEAHHDYLIGLIHPTPDLTLLEFQERVIKNCSERFSVSVMWRFFSCHGITFKKRPRAPKSRSVLAF